MAKRPESANWCFTINNPSVEDEEALTNVLPYKYLIFQYEMGDQELTMHIQGYFVLIRKMRLTALKKLLPKAHLEIRKGSHEQARDYCLKSRTKQDGPYEFGSEEGIARKKGQRSDLIEIKQKIDQGASSEVIWDEHFATSVRYHKSFESYRDLKSKHRVFKDGEKPKIVIYWGESGSGKTSRVEREYPGAYWLTKPSQSTTTVWWERYSGEEVVVFDEFYSWIPYDLMLRILDYYPVTVEKKGSSAKLAAKTFVFTSNSHPDTWYSKVKDRHALDRRIREFGTIEHVTKENFAKSVEPQDNGYISEEL